MATQQTATNSTEDRTIGGKANHRGTCRTMVSSAARHMSTPPAVSRCARMTPAAASRTWPASAVARRNGAGKPVNQEFDGDVAAGQMAVWQEGEDRDAARQLNQFEVARHRRAEDAAADDADHGEDGDAGQQ